MAVNTYNCEQRSSEAPKKLHVHTVTINVPRSAKLRMSINEVSLGEYQASGYQISFSVNLTELFLWPKI